MDAAPLVLTFDLDEAMQTRFDELRRRHFPPERNHLRAHVTAFHALPGVTIDVVTEDLVRYAAAGPMPVQVTGLRFLGRGVAYDLEGVGMTALRNRLARHWEANLTPQDRRPWRPHVTVQNKVEPETARALHASLTATFEPWSGEVTGLTLWWYRGGPWEKVRHFGREQSVL